MVRAASYLLALILATPAIAGDSVDPKVRAALEPYRPEILEMAQLMYNIGACEKYVRQEDADQYIRDLITDPPTGNDLAKAYIDMIHEVNGSLYLQGRSDAAKLHLDAAQCERAINAQVKATHASIDRREKATARKVR